MRIGLVQINPTVGDLGGNAERIRAAVAGAPPRRPVRHVGDGPDRLPGPRPAARARLHRPHPRARRTAGPRPGRDAPVLVGLPIENPSHAGRPLSNAAALLRDGVVDRAVPQEPAADLRRLRRGSLLRAGRRPRALDVAGRRAAVSVCEDVWNDRDFWQRPRYLADPIDAVEGLGAGVLVNLSASPFSAGKQARARGDARRARPQPRRPRRLREPGRRQRRPDLRRPQRRPRFRTAASWRGRRRSPRRSSSSISRRRPPTR